MTAGGAAPHYARAVGCADVEAGGPRPLEVGSTVPGFHVAELAPERSLGLAGSHRFSNYALVFRLDNYRDYDQHFVSALTLLPGESLSITVECQNKGKKACTAGMFWAGFGKRGKT